MKIKLNQDLRTPKGKKKKGDIIEIEADNNKIPLELFWRKRLYDSQVDNCIEIVEIVETKKTKK